MSIHKLLSGLLQYHVSVQRCFMLHLKTGSEGSLRGSIMRSKRLIQPRWILKFSKIEHTDMLSVSTGFLVLKTEKEKHILLRL